MTGRDAHIRVRVFDETRDALDEIIPEDVSRSEYLRQVYQNLIDENEEDVPEDLLREERRKRADERGQTHVDRATFRKRCKNLAKTLYGSGLADFEIKEGFAAKREEADHLPPRLKPEAAKEYVDCLLSLVYLFDSDAEPKQNLYISMDLVDKAYPDNHKEETRDIIRVAGVEEDILDELDDATANGLVDPLYDEIDGEDDDETPDMTDKTIRMGGDTRDDLEDERERRQGANDEDESDAPTKLLKVRVDDGSKRGQQMFVVDMIDSEYCVDDVISVVQTSKDIEDVRRAVDLWSEEEDAPEAMTDGAREIDKRAAYDAAVADGQESIDSETFEVDGEEIEYATRRERIRDVLDGELVGLTVSHRTSGAVYMIATRRVDWGDVDAEDAARDNWSGVDKRMIIWDTDDEDVVVTDRGYWTPEDADTMRAEARQASRASSEIEGQIDADGPLVVDATDEDKLDVDAFLSRSVEVVDEEEDGWTQDHDKMRETPGISPERDWGYYGGPPEEIEIMQQRLEEAGLNPSDHFFKLQFGRKDPIDMVDKSQSPPGRGVAADEVAGNYGVDSLSKDFGLVFVDVDDPDKFPDEELPETFSVSSPHGSDEQRHMVFVCDNKSEIFDGDVWSAQLEWGDLWAGGNRYIVGPGCQLSAYGCNHGEYRVPGSASGRDDNSCGAEDCDGWLGCERCRGGCDRCEDEEGGYYEIQDNVSVKAASAETFSALIPDDDDETEESGNPVSTGAGAPEGMVVADCCGAAYDEDAEGEAFMRAGNRVVCLGGCPDE